MGMSMKKRLLSLLLVLTMAVTLLPPVNTQAAKKDTTVKATEPVEAEVAPQFSLWAQEDLLTGDNYDIYPKTWYEKGMTKPIKASQLRVLLAGVRKKILKTECVTKELDYYFNINNSLTVEEVLNQLYSVIASYEYTKDLGLRKRYAPTAYMQEYGIFTGAKEELKLKDVCTVEQACVFASRLITHIYDTLDAGSKGFLWEINSGENKVYLLGSIHMASYDIYPFSKNIREAFNRSDKVAMELNLLDTTGSAAMTQIGIYTDGTTLKDHVAKETFEKTVAIAAAFGIPEEQIILFKPWMIYSMFASLANTESGDPEQAMNAALLGIDMNITVNAIYYGKPILEIEGYAAQAKVFDSFSDELEEYLLNDVIDMINQILSGDYKGGDDGLNLMLELWRKGDVETFRLLNTSQTASQELQNLNISEEEAKLLKEFNDKLIKQRDKNMADYIDDLLKSEEKSTTFVVVGSGHYISDYSVLDILQEKGYQINPIK
ncbi:MAG: TraB/GumN family protein [Lachnospiraceae bacterium]|nr:TraB/GumN family protein [Lachnospiraceae bacterium]